MGRPRSDYICPKCGKQGYKELNASRNGNYPNMKYRKYWRVVHYDSFTKKKKFCYIDYILYVIENKEQILDYVKRLEQMSPTEFQNSALELDRKHKLIRNNIKAIKDVYEHVASKYGIPLPKE
jgi:hypothetical protein